MENSIYIGLSRQLALQENMATVANNIANVNTAGYRGQSMLFENYIFDPHNKTEGLRGRDDDIKMVLNYGQYTDARPGPLKSTGNPLDVALEGPGFFGVQTADGIRYTRAGNFSLNVNGELVTPTGQIVASNGGGSIVVPPSAKSITITDDGSVATDQGQIGQLMISEFDNINTLKPQGDGLYNTDEAGRPAEKTRARQGMVEGSNVQAVVEMTRMIDVSREYQSIARMLQNEHDRQRSTIQRLTQNA